MDALRLLESDHRKVQSLMAKLEKAEDGQSRKPLFEELLRELKVHEQIEQQIFYPAIEAKAGEGELKDVVLEAYAEHDFVDKIASDIDEISFSAEIWPAKFKVMKENVEHHAKEEEEGKIFPKVQRMFSADELSSLGREMLDLKAELLDELPVEEEVEE